MKNFKIVTVNARCSDVIGLFESFPIDIVLVSNEVGRGLIGTVTHHDLRVAQLKCLSVHESIEKIMNSKPIYAYTGKPDIFYQVLMTKSKISSLPIIDNDMNVIEVIKRKGAKNPIDCAALVMAGGFGTRLHPYTLKTPKPMMKVGDKPLIERIVNSLVLAGITKIYISVHYLKEQIMNYFGDGSTRGIEIIYIEEDEPLGTGGCLSLINISCEDMVIVNGDILTDLDFKQLVKFHKKNNKIATMATKEFVYSIPYGVVHDNDGILSSFEEKPTKKYSINAGIYAVKNKLINNIEVKFKNMPDILVELLRIDSRSVAIYKVVDYWLDIGSLEQYEKANEDIKFMTSSIERDEDEDEDEPSKKIL